MAKSFILPRPKKFIMNKEHHYEVNIKWTGNKGTGTSGYAEYERSHIISAKNKVDILASSDTAFRGDATKYNPEDLLVSSVATCHMLWFLHLCSDAGICVTDYIDNPKGVMIEAVEGGHFTSITLNPLATVTKVEDIDRLAEIHNVAHKKCFIANSLNFPVIVNSSGKTAT